MELVIPRILQCNRYITQATGEHRRIVKDFEFDYYVGGERDIIIDGKPYKTIPGAIVFRKPDQITVGKGDYDCFILSMDFEKKNISSPDKYIRHRKGRAQSLEAASFLSDFPAVFIPKYQDHIRSLYEKLTECSYPNIVNENMQEKYMEELLLLLILEAKRYRRQRQEDDEDYINQICSYINQNYMHRITIEKLAGLVSLNKNYMIRLFRQRMNTTPIAYINQTRLFYAKTMLIYSNLSINEISINCGFRSAAYFTKEFKEKYGMPPSQYRKKYIF